jgi:spore maturation protein CgeB
VDRIEHMPPERHAQFYNAQRFTLNVTRGDMVAAGWSPSVRLFEAAACGVPVISDPWPGLSDFFYPRSEVLVTEDGREITSMLTEMPEEERRSIGEAARRRVLAGHTAAYRAKELETLLYGLCQPGDHSQPAIPEMVQACDSNRNIQGADALD